MEALANYRPNKKNPNNRPNLPNNHKSFVNCGEFFIELSNENIHKLLINDQQQINKQIDQTRISIKQKLKQLQSISPSEMPEQLLEFVLRESKREKENKQFEMSQEEINQAE